MVLGAVPRSSVRVSVSAHLFSWILIWGCKGMTMEAGCSSLDEYEQCLTSGFMSYPTDNTETRPMVPNGPVAVIGDTLGVEWRLDLWRGSVSTQRFMVFLVRSIALLLAVCFLSFGTVRIFSETPISDAWFVNVVPQSVPTVSPFS